MVYGSWLLQKISGAFESRRTLRQKLQQMVSLHNNSSYTRPDGRPQHQQVEQLIMMRSEILHDGMDPLLYVKILKQDTILNTFISYIGQRYVNLLEQLKHYGMYTNIHVYTLILMPSKLFFFMILTHEFCIFYLKVVQVSKNWYILHGTSMVKIFNVFLYVTFPFPSFFFFFLTVFFVFLFCVDWKFSIRSRLIEQHPMETNLQVPVLQMTDIFPFQNNIEY